MTVYLLLLVEVIGSGGDLYCHVDALVDFIFDDPVDVTELDLLVDHVHLLYSRRWRVDVESN